MTVVGEQAGTHIGDGEVEGTWALARFAHELRYDDLPATVQGHAAEVLLDMLGVIVWGAQDAFLRDFRERLLGHRAPGESTIFGSGLLVDPGSAALFNAAACTVTQIDEGHRRSRGHPGIHVLPAALAIAEAEGSSGRELLTAIVAGYEVAVRIGRAMAPLKPDLHAHGHWPILGAAVAGAKLLGADEPALLAALESAATLTLFPTARTANDGATCHHLYAGLGTQTAVTVAYGAAAGMTATAGTLVDYFGPLSSDAFRPAELAEGLRPGEVVYEILQSYFKFQPVCAHAITSIEAIDAIVPRVPAGVGVQGVTVRTYGLAADLYRDDVSTTLGAKFSIPFVVAARLLKPEAPPTELHYLDPTEPSLRGLMRRVRVVKDPQLDGEYPARRPAVVEVELDDGTRLVERRDLPSGDAENPHGPAALERKFHDLVAPVLGAERSRELVRLARGVADLPDVRALTRLTRLTRLT